MSILDMALSLATSQSDKIARIIGKPPAQVKSAIEQGKKMLPEIINSKDGGIGILNRLGVDKSFLGDMQKRYGSQASKIGLSTDTVERTINSISKAMDKKPPAKQLQNKSSFDSVKYPKI